MRVIADLHIHSKYSRAVSKKMDIDHIAEWCGYKGIDIVGTGDFTHPKWISEIKSKLTEDGSGLLSLKDTNSYSSSSVEKFSTGSNNKVRFMLSAEIANIYSQGGKVRRIHTVVLAPDIATVEKINDALSKRGNLYSDGRPILGMSVKEMAKIILDINSRCMVIPAHAWTPWFAVFGSKSGFDTLEECFEELTPQIFAIETGLSSDPEMNWRLSNLDKITLISNSDAHSMQNLGREANVFEIDGNPTYDEIFDILKSKDVKRFPYTVEFYPEEGKYHFDGDARCKQVIDPRKEDLPENKKSICGNPITVGVLRRVEDLANRPADFVLKNAPDSKHLVPLREIIAESFEVGVASKKVEKQYFELIAHWNEFKILLDLTEIEMREKIPSRIVDGIMNVRNGKLWIEPGYDGIYGKVHIFQDESLGRKSQGTLF